MQARQAIAQRKLKSFIESHNDAIRKIFASRDLDFDQARIVWEESSYCVVVEHNQLALLEDLNDYCNGQGMSLPFAISEMGSASYSSSYSVPIENIQFIRHVIAFTPKAEPVSTSQSTLFAGMKAPSPQLSSAMPKLDLEPSRVESKAAAAKSKTRTTFVFGAPLPERFESSVTSTGPAPAPSVNVQGNRAERRKLAGKNTRAQEEQKDIQKESKASSEFVMRTLQTIRDDRTTRMATKVEEATGLLRDLAFKVAKYDGAPALYINDNARSIIHSIEVIPDTNADAFFKINTRKEQQFAMPRLMELYHICADKLSPYESSLVLDARSSSFYFRLQDKSVPGFDPLSIKSARYLSHVLIDFLSEDQKELGEATAEKIKDYLTDVRVKLEPSSNSGLTKFVSNEAKGCLGIHEPPGSLVLGVEKGAYQISAKQTDAKVDFNDETISFLTSNFRLFGASMPQVIKKITVNVKVKTKENFLNLLKFASQFHTRNIEFTVINASNVVALMDAIYDYHEEYKKLPPNFFQYPVLEKIVNRVGNQSIKAKMQQIKAWFPLISNPSHRAEINEEVNDFNRARGSSSRIIMRQ